MFTRRWEPMAEVWSEMGHLQEEMNRLLGRLGNGTRALFAPAYPALNVWEDEQNVYVEAELPGLDMDSVEIYVHNGNQLSLKGERKEPADLKGTWHRRERNYGRFARVFELPYAVEADKVAAKFHNGVLLIQLPKREEAKPRRIEVRVS